MYSPLFQLTLIRPTISLLFFHSRPAFLYHPAIPCPTARTHADTPYQENNDKNINTTKPSFTNFHIYYIIRFYKENRCKTTKIHLADHKQSFSIA